MYRQRIVVKFSTCTANYKQPILRSIQVLLNTYAIDTMLINDRRSRTQWKILLLQR